MATAQSTFVSADLDASNWEQIEPLYKNLRDRPVTSADEFQQWLLDRSELDAACSEARAILVIATTCDTADEESKKAYLTYLEEVPPRLKPISFQLDKRHATLAGEFPLDQRRHEVIDRDTSAAVELFRDENVPLETDLDRLKQEFEEVAGAMNVEFDGKTQTLPQMARYLEQTDRSTRESAWRAIAKRRLQDADTLDTLYTRMIEKRHTIAQNAGFDNYVGYAFKEMLRFDYTPADCSKFHDAVEKSVVPLMRRRDDARRDLLGLDSLRPWDLAVDVLGRDPLRPFDGGVDLVSKTQTVFNKLDPRLGEMFAELGDGSSAHGARDGACLDLDSRQGKAPGGYQYMRDFSRKPFIFMNAAGLHRDVETMVHEAGHAFHSMVCVDEPYLHYRHSPIEFAEVASMTMELLTMPFWDAFYTPEDADRARRSQLEGAITILPWIATIDAFQHWIYANPNHTIEERTECWLALDARFGHNIDWSGLEANRAKGWQRQSHLFGHPFYYIEYGIALLGALQLWVRSLEEGPQVAIEAYLTGLKLGGSRPLPELFQAAGISLDFSADMMGHLMTRVERALVQLPE